MYDVVIIGAGVIGCSVARELSRYSLRVLVLEKNEEVCEGTTKANSAIVHGGYDALPGTLKARFNRQGNEMFTKLSKELEFPFIRNGSLVLAFSDYELKQLDILYKRGIENEIPGLEILDKQQTLLKEPEVCDEIKGSLYCSSAGIVCPFNMTYALIENAIQNGAELITSAEVLGIDKKDDHYEVAASKGRFKTRFLVNAAGLYSDKIANMTGDFDFEIIPRKGEYRILDKSEGKMISHVIFQAPTEKGKGVLVSPTVHGNIIVGPTAEYTDSVEDTSVTPMGLQIIDSLSKKSLPDIRLDKTIKSFAGVRASSDKKDFMIYSSGKSPGIIHAGAIESPGLAASPAIAVYIAELLQNEGLELTEDPGFDPVRKGIKKFAELDKKQQEELKMKDSKYKNIICRCEQVTQAEIEQAINRPAGATTHDGIKRRVRAGFGRCQGAYCTPKVLEILQKELNKE